MTIPMLLLKASLLLATALVAARLLDRGSATARHGLWSAAFAALLALPVFGLVAPGLPLSVPVPAAWRAEADRPIIAPVAAAAPGVVAPSLTSVHEASREEQTAHLRRPT